jgi:hypothetical protein
MRVIAEGIGMSESGFTRGVKRGTLSIENLLDLARVNDTHPSRVLRMAGKDRVADLLEQLYGPGIDALTASERDVIGAWNRLPTDALRRSFLLLMKAALPNAPEREELHAQPLAARAAASGARRSRRR